MHVEPCLVTIVAVYTAAAAVLDFRTQKVPNYLTIPAALLGVLYHSLAPAPYGMGFLFSAAGLATGFALLLLPFVLGGGGAGDVKLLAGLGAWLGWPYVLFAFAISAVIGMFMAISVLIYSACTDGVYATKKSFNIAGAGKEPGKPKKFKSAVRFAIPIAVGSWLVLSYLTLKTLTSA